MENAVFNPDTWGYDYDDDCYACGAPVRIASDEDGTPVKTVARITEGMIDRAAEAYVFGVMPGDESEATEEEIREMAERVLRAALRPSEPEPSRRDQDRSRSETQP